MVPYAMHDRSDFNLFLVVAFGVSKQTKIVGIPSPIVMLVPTLMRKKLRAWHGHEKTRPFPGQPNRPNHTRIVTEQNRTTEQNTKTQKIVRRTKETKHT